MASASNAFKMKCPSCEAGVTIRDASLVGKKVDCPKCKFRFVVEAPAETDGEATAGDAKKPDTSAPAKEKTKTGTVTSKSKNKPLPKKVEEEEPVEKKKGNRTLLYGGGLGVLAIAILVGAWLMGLFDGDDSSANAKKGNPPPQVKGPPPKKNPADAKGDEKPIAKTNETPKPKESPADLVRNEITNLLPEDSEWVLRLNGPAFLKTPVGGVLFEKSGESGTAFQRWMGFAGEDVDKFCCAGTKGGGFFSVTRFKNDHTIDAIRNAMQLEETPLYINKYTLFTIRSNELVKMLNPYITAKLNELGLPVPKAGAGLPWALTLIDPKTLVIGDQPDLDKFLKLRDLKRTYQTTYVSPEPAETAKKDAKNEKDGKKDGKNPREAEPKPADPKTEEAKSDSRPSFTSNESFLSVDPALKIMVNQLELDKPAVLSWARKFQDASAFTKSVTGNALPAGLNTPKSPVIGLVVRRLDENKLDVAAGIEFERSDEAATASQLLNPLTVALAKLLSDKLQTPIRAVQVGEAAKLPNSPATQPRPGEIPGKDNSKSAPPATSTLAITPADRYVIVALDVDWKPVYFDHINPSIRGTMDLLRGEALMMTGKAHWHALTIPVKMMAQTGAAVPFGAFPRPIPANRFGEPYLPDQRVGWMVELLPHLGYQGVSETVHRNEAWNSSANITAGQAWVPEFLNESSPESTWRAYVPSLNGIPMGATHFVGLSGVGMDAANFPDSPEFAKKLGIFGYDRQVKIADVAAADGLANTIFMIQVPPTVQRAWIRGGGSTVQGVPETGSIKPFVSATTKDGKKGTYALMADGSVRFLSEGISDDVMKALSTYKGGETIDRIDRLFPPEKIDVAMPAALKSGTPKAEPK